MDPRRQLLEECSLPYRCPPSIWIERTMRLASMSVNLICKAVASRRRMVVVQKEGSKSRLWDRIVIDPDIEDGRQLSEFKARSPSTLLFRNVTMWKNYILVRHGNSQVGSAVKCSRSPTTSWRSLTTTAIIKIVDLKWRRWTDWSWFYWS